MNLIPTTTKYTIVEVNENNKSSFIVCNSIGMDGGMTYIIGAVMKETMKLSRMIKYIDRWQNGVSRTELSHSCYYGVDIHSLIIPTNRVINITMCDSLDEMYPNTKIWSSRRIKDAEEICNKGLDKEEKEYSDRNRDNFLHVEDRHKEQMAFSEAGDMWKKLPFYKRMFLNENNFISSMANKIRDKMFPTALYADLADNGFNYTEWMEK